MTALQACKRIVQTPLPLVAVKGMDAMAIDIEILFRVASPANRVPARNEVIDAVHQQCVANGLEFAMPQQSFLFSAKGAFPGRNASSAGD